MASLGLLGGYLAASVLFSLAAQTIPPNIAVDRDIPYDKHPETLLDVYYPKEKAAGKRPAVIVIHGGGWTGGTKAGVVERYLLPWLGQGFVAANVEYRLAKSAPAPAAITDVLTAVQWFKSNSGRWDVDNSRIVVTGDSAGGHLSLMVGMTPKSARLGPSPKVAAVVNIYGITDVADQLQGPNLRQYAVTWVPEQEGRQDLARRVSPMTYVRKDVPAILTIHGSADETVPYEHGVQLTRALREAGADAEMISVPNGGHGFPPAKMTELYTQIFDFLRKRAILK